MPEMLLPRRRVGATHVKKKDVEAGSSTTPRHKEMMPEMVLVHIHNAVSWSLTRPT